MIKEDKYFDQVFRDKFADYEKIPPAFVWDNIQETLTGEKRKKRMVYWRFAGVAAALVIAFLAGWQLSKDKVSDTELVAGNTEQIQYQVQTDNHIKSEEIIVSEEIEELPENTSDKSKIIFLSKTDSKIFDQQIEQQRLSREKESISFVRSLQAVLKSQKAESQKLLERNNPLTEKEVFTPEELRIIDENRALLAMNNKNEDQRKWVVGAAVSPNYSVYSSSHSDEYEKSMAASGEEDKLNLGGGFSFEYKTRKKWSFQSGLYYNKMEQSSSNSTQSMYDYAASPNDAWSGYFTAPVSENNGVLEMNSVAGVIQIENLPSSVQLGRFPRS